MPGKDGGGFVVTTLLGIVGAVVGGYLGQALGLYESGAGVGFFMALIGAMIVLWVHRAMTRK
ncbi:MAG: GlsB/YeaQ/YmgE family stress response membrane protein [Acidobacteriota bacterium]